MKGKKGRPGFGLIRHKGMEQGAAIIVQSNPEKDKKAQGPLLKS